MATFILVLAIRKRLPGRARVAGGALAAVLALAAFGLPMALDRHASQAAAAIDARWTPFDKAAITDRSRPGGRCSSMSPPTGASPVRPTRSSC